MSILAITDPRFLDHDAGAGHPERPARLRAVESGIATSGVAEAVTREQSAPATDVDIMRVHPGTYLDGLRSIDGRGGGSVDTDTRMGSSSLATALLAAGSGLHAARRLGEGAADVAFCAVRPPGHHATPTRPMGFCLLNNIAITAASLAERGERVLLVDIDAHHGNGTQDVFYGDPRVHFVSLHQYPFYPGTGALAETGSGDGTGSTTNVPLPARTTGDVYRRTIDEVVAPIVDSWEPSWLLVSAGYDAHRFDPLTDLGLSAMDYGHIVRELLATVPRGRAVFFLEGGYDADAITASVAATFEAFAGERITDDFGHATSGGPGMASVDAVIESRRQFV